MQWIKFDKNNQDTFPGCYEMLVSNGSFVQTANFGIDNHEPYFGNDIGKIDGVTHWMPFPKPEIPKNEK